jgi:hypothetical protein
MHFLCLDKPRFRHLWRTSSTLRPTLIFTQTIHRLDRVFETPRAGQYALLTAAVYKNCRASYCFTTDTGRLRPAPMPNARLPLPTVLPASACKPTAGLPMPLVEMLLRAPYGSALSANRLQVKSALEIAFGYERQLIPRNLLNNTKARSFTFASRFCSVKSSSKAEPG